MSTLIDAPSIKSAISDPDDVGATPLSLARAVHARRSEYVRPHKIKVKIGTWNVAGCLGTDKDLGSWFVEGEGLDKNLATLDLNNSAIENGPEAAQRGDSEPLRLIGGDKIGLYVLGLQEIVDLNMTKEYMNRAVYADHSAVDKWKDAIEAAMPSGYELLAAEQMTGLLLLVYASPEVAATISNVSTKQVGTGLLGYFGNKGAVTTRLLLGETTRMVFVNCHLASGADKSYLDRRCWDANQILSKTQFDPVIHTGVEEDEGEKIGDEDFGFWFGDLNFRLDGLPGEDIKRILMLHTRGEYDLSAKNKAPLGEQGVVVSRGSDDESNDDTVVPSLHSRDESFDSENTTLPDPDDFPEDPSQDPTSLQATLDSLLPHDQLGRMIKQRKLFHDGWREGPITFLPSYKYDIGTVGLFDSSEKQRAPSWCDRILYRTRRDKLDFERREKEEEEARKKDEEMKSRGLEEDDDVLFSYDPDTDGDNEPPKETGGYEYDEYDENEGSDSGDVITKEGFHDRITQEIYTSHQRITSSDHKPIISIFTLEYDAVVPELKAKVHAEVARDLDRAENEGRPGITVVVEGGMGHDNNVVDFGDIAPLETKSRLVTVANTGGVAATFSFVERPSSADGDETSPEWLRTLFVRSHEELSDSLGQSVTLDPGETVSAVVKVQVTKISHIRDLNNNLAKLEEVLVLRIEDGRDYFVPIRATWLPTCLGRSIDELIRIPDGGIRRFFKEKGLHGPITQDMAVHCSAPKELFKLTEAMQALTERCVADEMMLEEVVLPRDPAWPIDPNSWEVGPEERGPLQVDLIHALDNDKTLLEVFPVEVSAAHKLEALSFVLLYFLESLTDGLIPTHLWTKVTTSLPNLTSIPPASWPDTKTQILDILLSAPNHNIAFVFLTATLSRVASELSPVTTAAAASTGPKGLTRRISFRRSGAAQGEDVKKRRLRERRYADVVGPLVCRVDAREKSVKDRARLLVEMFLRRDEDS